VLALAVKLDTPGPVFYAQERVGLHGRRFKLYKFRTMVKDADKLLPQLLSANEADGPVFKIKNDPRVTRVGRVLRRTSLDELPQFINVLKGDMSVVGPRPPLPHEVEQYDGAWRRRLSVKPGITCIWQATARSHASTHRPLEPVAGYQARGPHRPGRPGHDGAVRGRALAGVVVVG
jgi:lipopolysaccharide/colanic/teichoic acid biosynthesis glycosyltransferase